MAPISAIVAALLCVGDSSFAAVEAGQVNDSVDLPRVSETIVRIAEHVPAESAASIYKKSIHAIFTVRSDRELGTGFTFAAGYIVTNAHVVGDSATVEVEEQDGNKFRARVVRKSEGRDFAILEPEGVRPFTTLVPLLTGEAPEIGEALVVIGSPGGMKGTVTTGIVSQTYPDGVVQMNVAVTGSSPRGFSVRMNFVPRHFGHSMLSSMTCPPAWTKPRERLSMKNCTMRETRRRSHLGGRAAVL